MKSSAKAEIPNIKEKAFAISFQSEFNDVTFRMRLSRGQPAPI